MSNVIDEARKLKSRAMDARDQNDFERAIKLIEKAEQDLRTALKELKMNRQGTEQPGRFEIDIANQLVHIMGSKGGILRRRGSNEEEINRRIESYEAAADAYDSGYREFEGPESIYGIVNSYNLVQRLVSRIFIEPKSALDEDIYVKDLSVRRELLNAKHKIQQQIKGPRAEDEYAAADLALVCLLLGDEDWETSLDRFIYSSPPPQPYAIEVTLKLIDELSEAIDKSASAPAALKRRLAQARQELAEQ